ncbi:cupin domain-containing protein [Hydrogenophaga taeniospiralis]|jgi:quercetin dioxygenase-like cupin family protein|uniref:cupin domain-containing protein n=1 Tax=Hydrogenophaga taeniospiralis TaxID=65656 RepID=UPI001CF976E8|nr:cupin domain-containing protein [Hydrogenophaga taeniospiralis]MCB4364727.1 cupin domain-containing protein [Hydrogenophaga taeniospiralis]
MSRPQAVPTVQISNERVIVTEWRFAPGAETGWHRHAHDYVVVPMTGGELLLETPEGHRTSPLTPGQSYTRNVGVEHNVINPTQHEVVFVEIEMR